MVKGSILFPIDQEIDLQKLDSEIVASEKYTRWQDSPDKKGFSGLELDTVKVDGVPYQRVLIVWTDDGKHGYIREDLSNKKIKDIQDVIKEHKKDGNIKG